MEQYFAYITVTKYDWLRKPHSVSPTNRQKEAQLPNQTLQLNYHFSCFWVLAVKDYPLSLIHI